MKPAPNFLEPLWLGAAALAHVPWRWKMPWIWRSISGITDLNCFIYLYIKIYSRMYDIYIFRYRYQYMQTYIYTHLNINVPLVNIAMDLETGLEPLCLFHSFCLCYIDSSCFSLFPVIALTKCPGTARILVFDLLNYPLVMTNIAMV